MFVNGFGSVREPNGWKWMAVGNQWLPSGLHSGFEAGRLSPTYQQEMYNCFVWVICPPWDSQEILSSNLSWSWSLSFVVFYFVRFRFGLHFLFYFKAACSLCVSYFLLVPRCWSAALSWLCWPVSRFPRVFKSCDSPCLVGSFLLSPCHTMPCLKSVFFVLHAALSSSSRNLGLGLSCFLSSFCS